MAVVQSIPVFTQAIGRETKTVDNTAGGVGLTATVYKDKDGGGQFKQDARIAFITIDGDIETNDIRWTVDGTAPVAGTTGHLAQAGDVIELKGFGNITKFRAIREGASSGTLQVTYFI